MAPLTAARLNAEYGSQIDLQGILSIWFGDKNGGGERSPWMITTGVKAGGITLDGLDGARWDAQGNQFHAFAMSSLHGPAWLIPVVRYHPRYARMIARYALHTANNARLFQGVGLDADHQDHRAWKDQWDPADLLFYEALASSEWSSEKKFHPYATGDAIRLGWGTAKVEREAYLKEKPRISQACNNISLYSGNQIGFLGGICQKSNNAYDAVDSISKRYFV